MSQQDDELDVNSSRKPKIYCAARSAPSIARIVLAPLVATCFATNVWIGCLRTARVSYAVQQWTVFFLYTIEIWPKHLLWCVYMCKMTNKALTLSLNCTYDSELTPNLIFTALPVEFFFSCFVSHYGAHAENFHWCPVWGTIHAPSRQFQRRLWYFVHITIT